MQAENSATRNSRRVGRQIHNLSSQGAESAAYDANASNAAGAAEEEVEVDLSDNYPEGKGLPAAQRRIKLYGKSEDCNNSAMRTGQHKPASAILTKVVRREISEDVRKKRKRKVFERLFEDNKERQDRYGDLKQHLEKLEALHWEEVLSILHLYQ
jgi:hypothetical protein